jgi:hypothetical protein
LICFESIFILMVLFGPLQVLPAHLVNQIAANIIPQNLQGGNIFSFSHS